MLTGVLSNNVFHTGSQLSTTGLFGIEHYYDILYTISKTVTACCGTHHHDGIIICG